MQKNAPSAIYCGPWGNSGRYIYIGPVHASMPFMAFGNSREDAEAAFYQVQQLYAELCMKHRPGRQPDGRKEPPLLRVR